MVDSLKKDQEAEILAEYHFQQLPSRNDQHIFSLSLLETTGICQEQGGYKKTSLLD